MNLSEGARFSTMTRGEMFVDLTTVLSISVLNLSKLNILRSVRSMNRPRLKGKRRAIALRKVNSSVRHISKFDRNQSAGKVSRLMRRTLTEEQTRIMSCKPQERVFLPEVLELLGSSPGYGETNVAVPLVQCEIKKYWVHVVEVSEDAGRDKMCRPQPYFRES